MRGDVLAVDLGTSNTYLCKCPARELNASMLELWDERGSLDTAVLYGARGEPVVGEAALFGWAEMPPARRSTCRLRTRFKPEIGRTPQAREWTRDFLKGLLAEGRRRHLDVNPEGRRVYFGTPCEADEDWRIGLVSAAADAGFGVVGLLEEPLAVLVASLASGDLSPAEAQGRIAVVDFGGGTCDLTLLSGMKPLETLGDWWLGGRLFDDLFFQILADRNPGSVSRWKAAGAFEFVRLYWSRRLKERFSLSMAQNEERLWSGSAGEYGAVADLGWAEFIERARAFRPSPALAADLPDCPGSDGPCDLIGRLEALTERLSGEPELVLFSGGSSLWPFVPQVLAKRFPGARLLRSDRPGGAVARGLALLPALTARHGTARRRLRVGQATFVANLLSGPLAQTRRQAAETMASRLADLIIAGAARPCLTEYARRGGPMTWLEQEMVGRTTNLESQAAELLRTGMEAWAHDAGGVLAGRTREWFAEAGVASAPRLDGTIDLMAGEVAGDVLASLAERIRSGAMKPLAELGTALVTALGVLVGGVVAAGSAAVGPGGLLVGGLVALGGCLIGRSALERRLAALDLPAVLTKRLLSAERVDGLMGRLRERAVSSLNGELNDAWVKGQDDFERLVNGAVAREIAGLDALCGLVDRSSADSAEGGGVQ